MGFADGLYVAIGYGRVLTSTDGINYINRAGGQAFGYTGIAYGNGVWVAVGGDSESRRAMRSPDAVTWTIVFGLSGQGLLDVAYGNGMFVAVGYNGAIATSSDGAYWTNQASGTTAELRGVVYADGKFVTVGNSTTLTSTDGTTWINHGSSISAKAIAHGDGLFVASASLGALWTSANGTSWTARNSGTTDSLESLAFGAGRFVAVGWNNTVSTSTNGTTWSVTDALRPAQFTSVAHGTNGFVVVGHGGRILTSADGVGWTRRESGTTRGLFGVTYANGLYVAVGQDILSSTNGVDWTLRDTGPSFWFESVAYGKGQFVAVGSNGMIRTSADGANWSSRSSGTTSWLNGVTFGNDIFVAAGLSGRVLTSSNGVNWTRVDDGTLGDLYGVTFGNGVFVASAGLSILTSFDGVIWGASALSTPTAQPLVSCAYGAGYVAVGLSGTIYSSTDASSWSWFSRNSSTTANLLGVAFGEPTATYIAVGDSGTILQSAPILILEAIGGTWDQTAAAGTDTAFYFMVSGTQPIHYQWFKDGSPISGATADFLSLTNVQFAMAGIYQAIATNLAGSVTSAAVTLTVVPVIIYGPITESELVLAGSDVTFNAGISTGEPFRIEWRLNGAVIPGANSDTLTISNAQVTHSGTYSLTVSNAFGLHYSDPAILNVVPLVITGQPQSLSVGPGANIAFNVMADSTVPVTYQWRLDGVPIDRATNATLPIVDVQGSHRGSYTVVVSNRFGSVTSDPAILTVLIRPTIVHHPQSKTVAAGDTATLSVSVTNDATPPIAYRWRRSGTYIFTSIANQTTGTLTLANVPTNQAGIYTVQVSNVVGSVLTSSNAYLTVVVPATNQTVSASSNVSFAVKAYSAARLRYQWQFNGSDLIDATNATLTLPNVQPSAAGAYAVVVNVVTNVSIAPAIFPATLTVLDGDEDHDGLPDSWEITYGLRPDSPSDAGSDGDGDGSSNLEEYWAGTNPTNALSVLKGELQLLGPNRDLLLFRFEAVSNKSYILQSRGVLGAGGWSNLADIVSQPSNRVESVTNPVAATPGSHYYRLVLPPQ